MKQQSQSNQFNNALGIQSAGLSSHSVDPESLAASGLNSERAFSEAHMDTTTTFEERYGYPEEYRDLPHITRKNLAALNLSQLTKLYHSLDRDIERNHNDYKLRRELLGKRLIVERCVCEIDPRYFTHKGSMDTADAWLELGNLKEAIYHYRKAGAHQTADAAAQAFAASTVFQTLAASARTLAQGA